MNKQAHEHIKAELDIIMELHRKGELDNFTCGEIAKMAEERINK